MRAGPEKSAISPLSFQSILRRRRGGGVVAPPPAVAAGFVDDSLVLVIDEASPCDMVSFPLVPCCCVVDCRHQACCVGLTSEHFYDGDVQCVTDVGAIDGVEPL